MRRSVGRAAGAAALAAGVVGAGALWLVGEARYDDGVADLAPAPIGCTTTLEFDRPGTYTLFVETRGEVEEIDGDCIAEDRSYETDEAPRVALELVDDRGQEVDLDRADGPSYDRAGRRGAAVRTVEIEDGGDYRLTATADDADDAMVRVGRDPASGVAAIRLGAAAALLVGLVVGGLLMALAGRRGSAAPQPAAATPWPAGAAATVRPLAPPTADVPMAPPYLPRPASFGPHPPDPAAPAPEPYGRPSPPRPAGGWPGRGEPLPPPRPPS